MSKTQETLSGETNENCKSFYRGLQVLVVIVMGKCLQILAHLSYFSIRYEYAEDLWLTFSSFIYPVYFQSSKLTCLITLLNHKYLFLLIKIPDT